MQKNGVILKGKELHPTHHNKDNSIHVPRLGLPVDLEHGTHLLIFLGKDFYFVVDPIPPLDERRTMVLAHLVVSEFELKDLLAV